MDNQVIVILDTPLLDSDPWADAVFAEAGLSPVDNAAVTRAMAQDADAKKALLANISDPMGAQEVLSPHYRRIFRQLYGDVPRLGVYGTAWLVHLQNVSACVVDWSEVVKRAHAPNVTEWDRDKSMGMAKDFVHGRVDRYLTGGRERYLELEPGLAEEARVAQTLAFLKDIGLQ